MKYSTNQNADLRTALTSASMGVLWTCVVALVITPLVIATDAWDDSYFIPKWQWMKAWGLIGLGALMARSFLGRASFLPLHPYWYGALALWLVQILSILWADSPSLAAERCLNYAGPVLGLWIGWHIVRRRRSLLLMLWVFILVAAISAAWVLVQDFQRAFWPASLNMTANLPDWRGYLAGGLGNTNHLGDLFVLALIPTLILFAEARRRIALRVLFAAAVLLAAGLTIVWSVGSNLGLFAAALLMLGIAIRREGLRLFRRRRRWLALAAGWGLMLAFFLSPHPANPHREGLWNEAFGSERWAEGGPTRLVIWAGALEMIREDPWLGAGAGNFPYVFPDQKSPFIADRADLVPYQGLYTNAAHNILLQLWSETGILGVFVFLILVAMILYNLLHDIRWCHRIEFLLRLPLVGMWVAWLVQGMMNFSLQQPTGVLMFHFLILAPMIEQRSRKEWRQIPSFVMDNGWYRLRVESRDMKSPVALGVAVRIRDRRAYMLATLALFAPLLLLPLLNNPMQAQAEYAKARRTVNDPQVKELFLLDALEYHPWATGIRSHYFQHLVALGRQKDALEQLELVRRRLDSTELYLHEANALAQLGRESEARAAAEKFKDRHQPWSMSGSSAQQQVEPTGESD